MIYGLCLGIGSCNVCVVNARKTIWVLLVITEQYCLVWLYIPVKNVWLDTYLDFHVLAIISLAR
jgi:hypothetical protein